MNLLMSGLTWEACLVFLDVIVVMSNTFEQHLERLRAVFSRLRSAKPEAETIKVQTFSTESQVPGKHSFSEWNRTES